MALELALLIAAAAAIVGYWKYSSKPALHKQTHHHLIKAKVGIADTIENTIAKKVTTKAVLAHKFHAISIQSKDDACTAAKTINGQRFLANEAPSLPLPNCNAPHCHCNYVHFSDRRESDDDRRGLYSLQTKLYDQNVGHDRRQHKGRRKDDVDF